ncbi:hypothetical protein LAZ40_07100 [Cereibacter sphaeroides]|uniref:hypothetical protein n=1 Tax=Cereibacter sphaeroides TaxID=1063 RepID=UPI001F267409|nr:hypothetical protein [Cereibacter sphaeroides]MCE6958815.1 hypothetical protein [Cereibacter sphaeroides]MCE6973311.1 hypothetical protein [Cereibacter sphaeroides]
MKKVSLVLGTALALAACQPSPDSRQGLSRLDSYSVSEANRPMAVTEACTVTDARYVRLHDDGAQAQNRAQGSQLAGLAAGAVIGNALGRKVGKGHGRDVARALGTIGGAAIGASAAANASQARSERLGIQYTLRLAGRHGSRVSTVVQDVNRGQPVLAPGSRCRVVEDGWRVHVQPA